MTAEHFQAIYQACDSATLPLGLNAPPVDWWRALLVFAMVTGWRIDEILSFRREDLELDTGAILTRAADNKGGRDDVDYIGPEENPALEPDILNCHFSDDAALRHGASIQ